MFAEPPSLIFSPRDPVDLLQLLTPAIGTQMLPGSGDEIASIGRLLITERWLHRRRCQPCRWSHPMRKPKKQHKPLNDLSRSLIPFDPNPRLLGSKVSPTFIAFGEAHRSPAHYREYREARPRMERVVMRGGVWPLLGRRRGRCCRCRWRSRRGRCAVTTRRGRRCRRGGRCARGAFSSGLR